MLPQDKLDLIIRRRDEVSAKLAAGASGAEFGALSRELSEHRTGGRRDRARGVRRSRIWLARRRFSPIRR